MKIKGLTGYGLSSPYGDGKIFGRPAGVESIGLVEVHTDAGFVGIGETYAGMYAPELIAPVTEFLSALIVGDDPCDTISIQKKLEVPFVGHNGLLRCVISAIDIALWDIRAQEAGKPLYKLIADEARARVPVYASGGFMTMSSDEICDEASRVLDLGYQAYKMRIGHKPWAEDLERVEEARKTLDRYPLMIDAIQGTLRPAWTEEMALKRVQDLSQYNPFWVGEPLHPSDFKGLQLLKSRTDVPLAVGEAFCSDVEFSAYLASGAVDILQPDATQCGGITKAIEIIQESGAFGISVALHVRGSAVAVMANRHLASAFHEVEWLEMPVVDLAITKDMLPDGISVTNGLISAPDQPGLGVCISSAMKEQYAPVKGSGYRVPR